jgi:hypothetical protein
MTERWRRALDALGRVEPDEAPLRDRAVHGPRLRGPDRPGPGRAILAGAVALILAVGSFTVLRSSFDGGTEVAEETPTPSPRDAELDPDAICEVPEYDPNVALLGDAFSSVFGRTGAQEIPLAVLETAGEPGATIGGVAADPLRDYLDDPQARNAPAGGWRRILEGPDEVIFAAPPAGGYSDWWVVRFTMTDGVWRPQETELLDQHLTPAQQGRGLRLHWRGQVFLEGGEWTSDLRLTNERAESWSAGQEGYALWGVGHVFDPGTGGEVGRAARTVGDWAIATSLAAGERTGLPLSLGGALPQLEAGHVYDVVACVPQLGLASPVGSLRVEDDTTVRPATVLTVPFDGLAMGALGGGRLVVHNGCLAVESSSADRRPTYVLWPDGHTLVHRDGEIAVLIDAVGREIARIGDEVTLGGGYVPPDSADRATIGGLPSPCRSGGSGYFLTSGLASR